MLSPRLAAAARYVLPGRPVADIGTDHAYLPTHLVQTGQVPRAIAADVMPGPLDAARATVADEGLAESVELRLGNGLRVLQPGEAATATICGMGGPLIAEILAAGPLEAIERLVLQPMGGEERLREWLAAHGWRLVAEELTEDAGRIYLIMAAEPGAMALTEAELLVGPHLRRTGGPLLVRYTSTLLELMHRAQAGARRSDRPEALERVQELEQRIQMLEEVLADAERDHR
jgi:tRNA (adenine22-N1)-methyltransferase